MGWTDTVHPLVPSFPALVGANLIPRVEISINKSRKTSVGVGFRHPIIVVPKSNSMVKSVRQRPCKLSAASRPSGGSAGLELKLNRGRKLGSWRRKRAHMAGNIVRARWWPEQAPVKPLPQQELDVAGSGRCGRELADGGDSRRAL